jgi:hypothetical protein
MVKGGEKVTKKEKKRKGLVNHAKINLGLRACLAVWLRVFFK